MRANTFPAPRTRSSVPLVRAELDNGEQLIVGIDLSLIDC
jgi:hypothetical protein